MMEMTQFHKDYSGVSIFGKRILHVASPVRWKGRKYEVERMLKLESDDGYSSLSSYLSSLYFDS